MPDSVTPDASRSTPDASVTPASAPAAVSNPGSPRDEATDQLPRLAQWVDEALTAEVDTIRSAVGQAGSSATRLADDIAAMLPGGKRLRARFVTAGWLAAGGTTPSSQHSSPIRLGAAIELFQAAALFHDDIIDRSPVRRGRPSAHVTAAAAFTAANWHGDGDHFGLTSALLLGDTALIAAAGAFERSLAASPATPDRQAWLRHRWEAMALQVTAGQYLDAVAQAVPWGGDPRSDQARAREVILAKTSGYSVEQPLVLGAGLAGGDDPLLAALSTMGRGLGEAFQLRDDILGVYGTAAATGKPEGGDIREGKRTVLMSLAYERAGATDRAFLQAALGDPDLTLSDLDRVRTVVSDTGGLQAAEDRIDSLYSAAIGVLDSMDVPRAARRMIHQAAASAVRRAG